MLVIYILSQVQRLTLKKKLGLRWQADSTLRIEVQSESYTYNELLYIQCSVNYWFIVSKLLVELLTDIVEYICISVFVAVSMVELYSTNRTRDHIRLGLMKTLKGTSSLGRRLQSPNTFSDISATKHIVMNVIIYDYFII